MSQNEANLQHQLLRWAEDDYERGLSRLRDLGCEPNIHSVPQRIQGLLFAIQSAVEACEGFPMDTDRMKWIVGKLNEARTEAGIPEVENTGEANMHHCGYPADSSMCKASGH